MPVDANIALGIRPIDPMGTLGSLLNIANSAQQLQNSRQSLVNAQTANEQARAQLVGQQMEAEERKAAAPILQNISAYQDGKGGMDFDRLTADLSKAAPTTYTKYLDGIATTQAAARNADASVLNLNDAERRLVGKVVYASKGQNPEVVSNMLDGLRAAIPGVGPAVDFVKQYHIGPAGNDQKALDAALDMFGREVENPPTQQTMQTPQGVTVDNGQQVTTVSTKPGTTVPPGQSLPGTTAQKQLPPTTPTVTPTGQPGYLGPQPGSGAPKQPGETPEGIDAQIEAIKWERDRPGNSPADKAANDREIARLQAKKAQLPPAGFVPSGLAPGQAANIQNNFDEMNRHFGALQDSASGNALVQSITGNIKGLASKAITGTIADKKSYLVGLVNALTGNKVDTTVDVQTATDLLQKQFAQLNMSQKAATDAARTLVSAGQPHGTMNEKAIMDAADQVASQVKANMAVRNALSSYKMMGDVEGYSKARQKIEDLADPRIWQYESQPDKASRAAYLKSQPDAAALVKKAQELVKMGVIQ